MKITNKEQLKRFLPKEKKHLATDEIVALLNNPLDDDIRSEFFTENFISYVDLLVESPSYGLADYIKAIKFASHRMMGNTWLECYQKTFPDRYDEHLASGKSLDALRAKADGFSRTNLVKSILARGYIAPYVLNQPLFQKALNTAASIMLDEDASHIARVQAAKTVLEYTKAPEIQKVQMEVGVKANEDLIRMEKMLHQLAETQDRLIQEGKLTAKEVIESNIIDMKEEEENEFR